MYYEHVNQRLQNTAITRSLCLKNEKINFSCLFFIFIQYVEVTEEFQGISSRIPELSFLSVKKLHIQSLC